MFKQVSCNVFRLQLHYARFYHLSEWRQTKRYWPKHNLQIGRTLLSNGLPGSYLRLCCFDVHGHRHDLQSRTTGVSTILTALA